MHYELSTKTLRFSPSDLTTFLESEFASWMDRWHAEKNGGHVATTVPDGSPTGTDTLGSEECRPDEKDEQLMLLAKKGIEHEKAFLQRLREQGNDIAEFDPVVKDVGATLQVMKERKDIVFQARLEHENFGGFSDFLARREGKSSLGNHHYEVWDTKLARSPKPYFIIQLCAYSEMLEHLQGRRPEGFEVVLGTNERIRYLSKDFIYYFRAYKKWFLKFHEIFDPKNFPHPGNSSGYGSWTTFAESVLEASDHLRLVANITRAQITKLEEKGVTTLSELAHTKIKHIPKVSPAVFQRLKKQAQFQLQSKGKQRPIREAIPVDEEFPRRGLALLPPASPNDVFFDIEGFPLSDDGLEYLLGASYLENGESRFIDWWAHDDIQEKKAFEDFIDWVYERWRSDRTLHIYHYAAYEVTALNRLSGKYATREREVDSFLRNHVFVDLYKVVRQGLIVGTSGYSLKEIEKLYLEERDGEVTTAGGSIVAYQNWMESRESEDWRDSPMLEEIRDYNEVDCVSTWKLADYLRDVQIEAGIDYFPPENVNAEEEIGDSLHRAKELSHQLLREVETKEIWDDKKKTTQQLMAWILEYHWRESKPTFWRMYDRLERSEQELIDDFDCLGGLTRTSKKPEPIKRSFLYEYRYDPDQDTKLYSDSKCYIADEPMIKTILDGLDTDEGRVVIKLGPSAGDPPRSMSLIPDEHVSADIIAKAVYRYVDSWSQGKIISQAVDDLINRRPPRIQGHQKGPIIPEDADLLSATVDTVTRMDNTILCIQGPPGTGKTYTAAQAILQLLQEGKKVGVTANSHKAILNVLRAVHEASERAGRFFDIYKVGGDADDPLIENGDINHLRKSADAVDALSGTSCVVGGTAWVFSREELESKFDYLFIDEAGQFSLANVVGTGLSANNIVLVGDQMQLSQPSQGTHPGESGQSALDYLLDGKATIPPEFGIFLEQTWRMHPKICGFISKAIYEDRLISHPGTKKQRIHLSDSDSVIVSRDAGIVFVPVEHEGNSQRSEEEADVIERIVSELVGKTVSTFDGEEQKSLTLEDILLVAPFNMQVRLLQDRLGEQARVGSVDKFQGQEAHAVIISMCSSTLEDSPRGAEFLLDPNRINVAVSRARSLAIVVGSPEIMRARCKTIKEMKLLNLYCWLVDYAGREV